MTSSSVPRGKSLAAIFIDRQDAGDRLAQAAWSAITALSPDERLPCIVYALPKGGLPIAEPIARQLGCPLTVLVAKKITAPSNQELAIGAVTADGQVIWARNMPRSLEVDRDQALHQAQQQSRLQQAQFLTAHPGYSPGGAIALVVDDGIATGMTMAAAVQSLKVRGAAQVWICAPVAPLDLMPSLRSLCDRVLVLATPTPFYNVGRFYQAFPQVSMEEALECLQRSQV